VPDGRKRRLARNTGARKSVFRKILLSEMVMAKRSRATKRRPGKTATRRRAHKTAASARRRPGKSRTGKARSGKRRWSHRVTERSDALDLRQGVFKLKDPKKSPPCSSVRRKRANDENPTRSVRAVDADVLHQPRWQELSAARKKTLMRAKDELRKQFGRE